MCTHYYTRNYLPFPHAKYKYVYVILLKNDITTLGNQYQKWHGVSKFSRIHPIIYNSSTLKYTYSETGSFFTLKGTCRRFVIKAWLYRFALLHLAFIYFPACILSYWRCFCMIMPFIVSLHLSSPCGHNQWRTFYSDFIMDKWYCFRYFRWRSA